MLQNPIKYYRKMDFEKAKMKKKQKQKGILVIDRQAQKLDPLKERMFGYTLGAFWEYL